MQLQMFTRPLSEITWRAFGMFQKAIFLLLLHIRPMAAELYKCRDHGNSFVLALNFKQESGPHGRGSGLIPGLVSEKYLSRYSLRLWCHCYYFSAPDWVGASLISNRKRFSIYSSARILPTLLVPFFGAKHNGQPADDTDNLPYWFFCWRVATLESFLQTARVWSPLLDYLSSMCVCSG